MRYAICFTPPMADPLSAVAASWLGRNVYSGEPTELPSVAGLSSADIAYHTAVPRRFGFHAMMMSPFRLHPDMTESQLLKALMHFAGAQTPFETDRLEVARIGRCLGLMPQVPSTAMHLLAANVVQEFNAFRAPLSEDEIERSDPDRLTAPQFSNLHRWGAPHVMDEYRFHMLLTGPLARTRCVRSRRRFATCSNRTWRHRLPSAASLSSSSRRPAHPCACIRSTRSARSPPMRAPSAPNVLPPIPPLVRDRSGPCRSSLRH